MQTKVYAKTGYALDVFEELIPLSDDFLLSTLLIANDDTQPTEVEVEMVDAIGDRAALIIPSFILDGKESRVLEVRSLSVGVNYALHVRALRAGISFIASGVLAAVSEE